MIKQKKYSYSDFSWEHPLRPIRKASKTEYIENRNHKIMGRINFDTIHTHKIPKNTRNKWTGKMTRKTRHKIHQRIELSQNNG